MSRWLLDAAGPRLQDPELCWDQELPVCPRLPETEQSQVEIFNQASTRCPWQHHLLTCGHLRLYSTKRSLQSSSSSIKPVCIKQIQSPSPTHPPPSRWLRCKHVLRVRSSEARSDHKWSRETLVKAACEVMDSELSEQQRHANARHKHGPPIDLRLALLRFTSSWTRPRWCSSVHTHIHTHTTP